MSPPVTRVLFTTAPMAAHVRPTVPLVRELVDGGHLVTWYTGAEFESVVASTGARFVAADPTLQPRPTPGKSPRRGGFSGLNRLVIDLFLRPIPGYVRDLAPVFDELRPEVVVADHSFRAGLFLAEQRGIPRVAFSAGPLNLSSVDTAPFGLGWPPAASARWGRLRNRVMSWLMHGVKYRERQRVLGAVRAQMGLRALPGYSIDWVAQISDCYLQTGVPEFEYPRSDLPRSVTFIGPAQADGIDGGTLPSWWAQLAKARSSGRPIVFVTQGTIATDLSHLVIPTISALASADVLLVATTSGQDPETVLPLAHRPDNLLLEPFISYAALLPMVDLIVTNGGYGGVQTALMHGVPLVVSGTSEDRMETNARVAWSGAGISLKTARPTPADLAGAVQRVLAEPSYRNRARALQKACAAYTGQSRASTAILEAARDSGR